MKYIDCNGNELIMGSEIELTAGSRSEDGASCKIVRCTLSPFTAKYLVKEGLVVEVNDCECKGSDNDIDESHEDFNIFMHEKFPLHCKLDNMISIMPEDSRIVMCWDIIQEKRMWSKQFRRDFIRNLDNDSRYTFLINTLMDMLFSETDTEEGKKFCSKEKDAELVNKVLEYYDPSKER